MDETREFMYKEKKKKILLLMNCIEREQYIAEMIQDELLKNVSVECKILYWNLGINEREIWQFDPDVVMTFPLTMRPLINVIARIKVVCKSTIVSFVTEGFVDPKSYGDGERIIGYYDFPKELVDYWGVWGQAYGEILWKELRKKERIAKKDRIIVFGYPLWEYAHLHKIKKVNEIEKEVLDLVDKPSKSVLVVSGFSEANKSKEDIYRSIDAYNQEADEETIEKQIKKRLIYVENDRNCREKYYSMVRALAEENPQISFIIKLHPKEVEGLKHNIGYKYDTLTKYNNVKVLTGENTLGMYIRKVDCVVHYGSTVSWEAYACGIPTVRINLINKELEHAYDAYAPGYIVSNEKEIVDYFKDFPQKADVKEEYDRFLKDVFNFERGKKYTPSFEIAKFLCGQYRMQKPDLDVIAPYANIDIHFKKSILKAVIKSLISLKICRGFREMKALLSIFVLQNRGR